MTSKIVALVAYDEKTRSIFTKIVAEIVARLLKKVEEKNPYFE